MYQPRDIDWLGGYKNKNHIYVVCKRPTSDLQMLTDKSRGMGEGILNICKS